MIKPKVLIFSGYGFNSEYETQFGFDAAGADTSVVHINDVIDGRYKLSDYQIFAFPGGFSYGDDTGSGNAYANKVRNHLWEEVRKFLEKDKLVIGICNGFQVLVNLGLVPALERKYGDRQAALLPNETARLVTRWTDLEIKNKSPWLSGLKKISLPIAHGEGKFYASDSIFKDMQKNKQIALQYIYGEIADYLSVPANPNGSLHDIAGVTDETGKVLGLMPHPERGMFFVQRPDWHLKSEKLKREGGNLPEFSDGIKIFQNAVQYFQ